MPDFTIYYQMVSSIAQRGFSPEEIKAQSHIQFITDQLETIKSISQATAALKMVASATLSDEELSRVLASLAKAFGQASDDPRAFAFAVQRDGLISAADSFISLLKSAVFQPMISLTRSVVSLSKTCRERFVATRVG